MNEQQIARFVQRVREKTGDLYWRSPHTGEILKVIGYNPKYDEFKDDMPEPVAVFPGNKVAALYECSLDDFFTMQPAFPEVVDPQQGSQASLTA
jgi:hypothetical protein